MPDLSNSQRRLYKATYAPIQPDPTSDANVPTQRAAAKASFVAGLAMRPTEIAPLTKRLGDAASKLKPALSAITALVQDTSPAAGLRHAAAFASISAEDLQRVGRALVDERKAVAARTAQIVADARDGYGRALSATPAPAAETTAALVPAAITLPVPAPAPAAPAMPAPTVTTVPMSDPRKVARIVRHVTHAPSSGGLAGKTLTVSAQVLPAAAPPASPGAPAAAAAPPRSAGTIEDALAWAADNQPAAFQELLTLTASHAPVPLAYSNVDKAAAASHFVPKAAASAILAQGMLDNFAEQMAIEPVGRLHLERLDMTPVGLERGELVNSIPLTPKETVNVSHRQWSVSSEEYSSIVQDYFEGFSETGVAEKTDVAQATANQSQRATQLNFGVSASASFMGVTLSSSFGYGSNSNDTKAATDSRNHSVSTTRLASSRTRKDNKTSFRLSSVAGTEDQAVRVITNPSDTESMRVDYYQLMRKWRVDLYRYGLRMTYDIVIPSPGADLLQKFEQIQALDAQINTPFDFTVKPTDVTRNTWQKLAALYQAGSVEAPPKQVQYLQVSADVQKSHDDKDQFFVGSLDFDVDPDYSLTSGYVIVQYYHWDVGNNDFALLMDVQFDQAPQVINQQNDHYPSTPIVDGILNRSGHLSVGYFYRGVAAAKITLDYGITLRDEVYQAWQFRAWTTIRQAAQAQYEASRQQLKDSRAALATELSPFDALTLRRMELEEVEKGVLRWLFGPSFSVTPPDISQIMAQMANNDPLGQDALDPSSLSNQQWQRMMEFGEFIKYLQQAIEWENVLYFTYPYYWDPQNWDLKRFLQHPDAIHRTFLRAGSARVVLTIRPGFEDSFTQLIESGAFNTLPGDHPYVTIAQEIQDYANTHYPGIPPANPSNPPDEASVTAAEKGELQATWYEYTPTNALDVSLNTSLPTMA
jgi:hypothetical protein